MKTLLSIILTFVLIISCSGGGGGGGDTPTVVQVTPDIKVTGISLDNGALLVNGNGFSSVTSIKIDNVDKQIELAIEESTDTLMRLKLKSPASIVLSKAANLLIQNAKAEESFPLTFELSDGQVTQAKISNGAISFDKIQDVGANDGDVISWDNENQAWISKSLNFEQMTLFKGVWDASSGLAPSESPNEGDTYIVSVDGDTQLGDISEWVAGDYAIFTTDGWDKVSNTGAIRSVNSQTGVVVLDSGDITEGSNLYFTNERARQAVVQNELNSGETILAPSQDAVVQALSEKADVSSVISLLNNKQDNLSNSDITNELLANQAVTDSKISGVTTPCASGEVLISNGTGGFSCGQKDDPLQAGQVTNLNIQNGAITESKISGVSSACVSGEVLISNGSGGFICGDDQDDTLADTDELSEGSSNLYFTNERARQAVVQDSINNGESELSPSQNAVFDALSLKADQANVISLLNDKQDALTANDSLSLSSFSLLNQGELILSELSENGSEGLSLRAKDSMDASFSLTFPGSQGQSGQTLVNDGSGNLSWENLSSGSVTSVSATNTSIVVGGSQALPSLSVGTIGDGNISSGVNANKIANGSVNNEKFQYLSNVTSDIQGQLNLKQNAISSTDDILEGSNNLYYSPIRARNDVVVDSIVDGAIALAPSQNAVFDALALKQNTLVAGSVGTNLVADQSITNTKINGLSANCNDGEVLVANGNGSFRCEVKDNEIAEGSISTSDLASGAVTSNELASGSVNDVKIDGVSSPCASGEVLVSNGSGGFTCEGGGILADYAETTLPDVLSAVVLGVDGTKIRGPSEMSTSRSSTGTYLIDYTALGLNFTPSLHVEMLAAGTNWQCSTSSNSATSAQIECFNNNDAKVDKSFNVTLIKQGSDARQAVQVYRNVPKVSDNINEFSAYVSAGNVSDENADWIEDNCRSNAAGDYTCSYINNLSTVSMNCTATPVSFTSLPNTTTTIDTNTPGSVRVRTYVNGAQADATFVLSCQKRGGDYQTPRVQEIVVNQVGSTVNSGVIMTGCDVSNNGAAVITNDSGACNGWLDRVVRPSQGYLNFDLAANIFKGTPACNCTVNGAGGDFRCNIYAKNAGLIQVQTVNANGNVADVPVALICIGAR